MICVICYLFMCRVNEQDLSAICLLFSQLNSPLTVFHYQSSQKLNNTVLVLRCEHKTFFLPKNTNMCAAKPGK